MADTALAIEQKSFGGQQGHHHQQLIDHETPAAVNNPHHQRPFAHTHDVGSLINFVNVIGDDIRQALDRSAPCKRSVDHRKYLQRQLRRVTHSSTPASAATATAAATAVVAQPTGVGCLPTRLERDVPDKWERCSDSEDDQSDSSCCESRTAVSGADGIRTAVSQTRVSSISVNTKQGEENDTYRYLSLKQTRKTSAPEPVNSMGLPTAVAERQESCRNDFDERLMKSTHGYDFNLHRIQEDNSCSAMPSMETYQSEVKVAEDVKAMNAIDQERKNGDANFLHGVDKTFSERLQKAQTANKHMMSHSIESIVGLERNSDSKVPSVDKMDTVIKSEHATHTWDSVSTTSDCKPVPLRQRSLPASFFKEPNRPSVDSVREHYLRMYHMYRQGALNSQNWQQLDYMSPLLSPTNPSLLDTTHFPSSSARDIAMRESTHRALVEQSYLRSLELQRLQGNPGNPYQLLPYTDLLSPCSPLQRPPLPPTSAHTGSCLPGPSHCTRACVPGLPPVGIPCLQPDCINDPLLKDLYVRNALSNPAANGGVGLSPGLFDGSTSMSSVLAAAAAQRQLEASYQGAFKPVPPKQPSRFHPYSAGGVH